MDHSTLTRRLLTSALGALASAALGVVFKKAFDEWGILDPIGGVLGTWLKAHVSGDTAAWAVAALLGLTLYGLVLWKVWQPRDAHLSPVAISVPSAPSLDVQLLRDAGTSRLGLSSLFSSEAVGEDLPLADSVSPSFLMAMAANRTEAQATSATAMYLGKRLKVRGPIVEVSNLWGSMSVSITLESSDPGSVYMIFDVDHDRLMLMHPGETLAATGRIKRITRDQVELFDCRLLPVDTQQIPQDRKRAAPPRS